MSVSSDSVRQSMRYWATGVTIVTAAHKGQQHGMTVSSFTSLSLDPPRLLISLAKGTRTCRLVALSRRFGVSLLAEDQRELSDRFAGRMSEEEDRLAGLEVFQLATGAPLLKGALAWLDCRVTRTMDSGSHLVFIAEPLAALSTEDSLAAPLLYFNRSYLAPQKALEG